MPTTFNNVSFRQIKLACVSDVTHVHNLTVEERVTVLEAQMELGLNEIDDLNFDVDFLFIDQAIQDLQMIGLDQETEQLEDKTYELEDVLDGENRCSVFDRFCGACSSPSSAQH